MEITISGKDRKSLKLVEELAKKLGLSISPPKKSAKPLNKNNGEELYKLMKEKAKAGGIKSIKNPVKWQREQRKDKPLYGREE